MVSAFFPFLALGYSTALSGVLSVQLVLGAMTLVLLVLIKNWSIAIVSASVSLFAFLRVSFEFIKFEFKISRCWGSLVVSSSFFLLCPLFFNCAHIPLLCVSLSSSACVCLSDIGRCLEGL